MKNNKKLETMLNKVVEFSKSNENFKGFLYKNDDGYYMKIIEVGYTSKQLSVDDIHYLNKGDSRYIDVAQKPKLMRVSLKSWHYRLVKFVLGSNAPTPKNMQNGCPYFWLLMFSIIVSPFVGFYKLISKVLGYLLTHFDKFLEKTIDKWIENLPPYKAYDICYNRSNKLSFYGKLYYNNNEDLFFEDYIYKKYGVRKEDDIEKWMEIRKELGDEWSKHRNRITDELFRRKEEREKERLKKEERKRKFNEKIDKITDKFNELFSTKDWKTIIKRTKQFVGFVITMLLLAMSYGIVLVLTTFFVTIIEHIIANPELYMIIGLSLLGGGLLAVLIYIFLGWVSNIVSDYKLGERRWYVDAVIFAIYNPIYYILYGLYITGKYILYIPLKFIFVDILWNFFKGLWKVLVGASGIFGEYFNASYTDYCPGIEWVDVDEDESK